MKNKLKEITENFESNVESVFQLMDFDHLILDLAIRQISDLNEKLKRQGIENERLRADRTLQVLNNIKEHESFKEQYSAMFNQCVVLLVSYYSSSLKDIFTRCLTHGISIQKDDKLKKEEIKLSLAELKNINFDLTDNIGDLVAAKNDISFQDMQSIQRAFTTYFGYCPERSSDIDNIILAQACRHSIVHSGGAIDSRLLNQVRMAKERVIKKNIDPSGKVSFVPEEIKIIGESMKSYVKLLSEGLLQKCGKEI